MEGEEGKVVMDQIKLSVIIPVYNVERYLRQCLESVIHQTYQNLEIILVDDGSTDASAEICDEYAALDDRISVIHQFNSGLLQARYKGLLAASAEYVTFVDSDDWIQTDMYEFLMSEMLENEADLVTSNPIRYTSEDKQLYDDDGIIQPLVYDRSDIETKIIPVMLWCEKINVWALDPALWSKIFKKNIFLN